MKLRALEAVPDTTDDFAMQSTLNRPEHVAIIMDGNRRWARRRGLPGSAGHRAGLNALEALIPAVREEGIHNLSLFGFASANWRRSGPEVNQLMRLAEEAIDRFVPRCVREGIRIEVIGRRDRLPGSLVAAIERATEVTAQAERTLRVALDYSSRAAIVDAAAGLTSEDDPRAFAERLGVGDVDLLIRTGKEQRLSDFLLWECAFAELYFPDLYWPEFDAGALAEAISWYRARDRRFGR
jgi:undecaprenyl diphosphate synthase